MSFSGLNYLAIVIATIAGFGLGAIWYALLFSRPWLDAVGLSEEQVRASRSPLPFVVSIVAELVMAVILAALMRSLGTVTIAGGIAVAFFVWLGFVITTMLVNNGYAMRKPMLSVIDGAHWLAVLVVMGVVIGAFG